jgi:endonuclease YncB( thermonuclease family)
MGTALGGAAVLLALSSDLFGSVPAATSTISADPAQVAVVDGETLRLRGTVVRLSGVTAPPRGLACGGTGVDCGAASSKALAGLVRNRVVSCRMQGRDGNGVVSAICDAAGVELNRAQVNAGWARAHDGSPELLAVEAQARDGSRGIWRRGSAPGF